MVLEQEMLRDDDSGEVVARARVTAVWIGSDRKPPDVQRGLSEGTT